MEKEDKRRLLQTDRTTRRRSVRFQENEKFAEEGGKCSCKEDEDTWNKLFQFGNSHYLGKIKENPDYVCIFFEVFGVILCLIAMYVCYFHYETFHFHVAHTYAKLGHPHAQHIVGESMFHGKGVEKNISEAMMWYKKAADQGHPESSYNLAVGHFTGLKTDLQPGEAKKLISHAADNGIVLAVDVLENYCKGGKCD